MKKSSKKFNTIDVLTVSATHLLHDTFSSFLAPILPLIKEKLGISYFLLGLLSAIQRLPSFLMPFIGLFSDKLPTRYLLIIAPAITAISMSLLGMASSYIALAILLLFMGIGSSLFHVPAPVMLKHISGNKIGLGMSFYMLGGEIARSIGPIAILGAVSLWGLEGTYRLIPFGLGASFILFLRLRNIKISDDFGKKKEYDLSAIKTIKQFLPFLSTLGGYSLSRSLMKSALTFYLPSYLTVNGYSLWMAGISLSILQFAGAFGAFFAGFISDKIGRKKMLLVIAVSSPLAMLCFLYSSGVLAIVLLLFLGITLFSNTPVMLAYVQDQKTDRPAFLNSIYMTLNFVAGMIGTLMVGFLSDKFGLDIVYKLSAIIAFGAIIFTFMLKKDDKK